MQLTFTSLSSEAKSITLPYPADLAGSGPYEERVTELNESWGKFRISDLWFEGICVCTIETNIKQPCTINLYCDNFCWIMSFVLDGELSAKFGDGKLQALKDGRYHTICTSLLNTDLLYEQSAKIFAVCLTRKFISKLIGKELKKDTIITKGNYRHTRLHAVIKEIMEAPQQGYIRRIFIESKILELLSLQLQQAKSDQGAPRGFNREDIARLQEAKVYIAQNMQTPCSLIELARKTGLNDFKLKKGFKALFGNTVFGYLFDLRMDTAYTLLQDDKSVSEVAELIGYKNPHHFTAAFKKRFGFLPSQVNKMQL